MADPPDDVPRTSELERDETPSERADRNFEELVQELRVAQTGVQILFGFLLALTFYDTFPVTQSPHPEVLTAALLCAAAAALCFMAPAVAHRVAFREGAKEQLVWVGHVMLLLGMVLYAVSLDLSLWLVLARLWTQTAATVAAVALVPIVAALWAAVPRRMLRR